jgi:hypothetical protein
MLWTLEAQRDDFLAQATRAIAQSHAEQAICFAEQAHGLRAGPDSLRVLAWGHLLQHNFTAAWRCLRQREE